MKQGVYTITENIPLTGSISRMRLAGDTSDITAPGQFINLKLPYGYLRRPISICDWDGDSITIIYKVLGKGTEQMRSYPVGMKLDILTGLGNGFDASVPTDKPVLIGGGVGIPPLYRLAKELLKNRSYLPVILGFNNSSEIFYRDEFEKLGCQVILTTADGSTGIKGFVTDALKHVDYDYFYTCGPEPMLKAVYSVSMTSGQMSFEKRMGCGFGACMGCSCKTITGNKRICKEGPVLRKEEIIWGD